jgi:hypothetical protein
MKANPMTIYRFLVPVLLLAPVLPVAAAEEEAPATAEAEAKIWRVYLMNGDEFYAEEVGKTDRTVRYKLDKPGSRGTRTFRVDEVDWERTKEELSRKRDGRVEEQYRELGKVKVTMADGSVDWKDQNEVALAEWAFDMAAKLEATQAPPPMPERDPAAEGAVETAPAEETQDPGSFGAWGARIVLVIVAVGIVALLLKTLVLTNPE